MAQLVLLRHGESEWNQDDRFAGWVDIGLTARGIVQAQLAGQRMRERGLDFDVCFTSMLRRATHSAWHCLDAMDRSWLPRIASWRLNERHYGALHGLDKGATALRFGEAQLQRWRRSPTTRPPPQTDVEASTFSKDRRYAGIKVPRSESPRDVEHRLRKLWEASMRPSLQRGERVLVVAHGTSLRAFIRILCGSSEDEIAKLEIPNAVPLLVDLQSTTWRTLYAETT